MGIMTHAKFHFNQLILTLIFGIRASDPPPRAWGTTEKAGPDTKGLKETMVEVKTFVKVASNVNKVGKGGLYLVLILYMSFARFLPHHFGVLLVYHSFFFSYTVSGNSLAGDDCYSILYFAMYFKTLNSSCRCRRL